MGHARMLVVLVATVAVAIVAVTVATGGDTTRAPNSDARSVKASRDTSTLGCRDRIEGRRLAPDSNDTRIGSVTFIDLARAFRDQSSDPSSWEPYAKMGMPAVKIITVVRADARVRLVVPKRDRRWLRLAYVHPIGSGTDGVTLRACRQLGGEAARRNECGWGGRSPESRRRWACRNKYTQFAGGFGVDFEHAPRLGICARLTVTLPDEGRTVTRQIFKPERGVCES